MIHALFRSSVVKQRLLFAVALALVLVGGNASASNAVTSKVPAGHGVVVIVHNIHASPPETRAIRHTVDALYWIDLENVADGKNQRLNGYMIDDTHRLFAGAVPAGRYRNISQGRGKTIAESILTVRAGTIHDEGMVVFMHDRKGSVLDAQVRSVDPTMTRMRLAEFSPGLADPELPIDSSAIDDLPGTAAARIANEYLNATMADGAVHVGSSAGMLLVWPVGEPWMDVIDTGLTVPLDIVAPFGDGTWLVGGGFMQLASGRVDDPGTWRQAVSGLGVGRSLSARAMPDGHMYLLHLEGKDLVLYRTTDATTPWREVSRHPASEPWKGSAPRRFQSSVLHVAGDELLFLTAPKVLGAYNVRSGRFESRSLPGRPLMFQWRADGLLMSLSGVLAAWHSSTDQGRHWTQHARTGDDVLGHLAMRVDDTLLRLDLAPGGTPGPTVMRSTDLGKTWQAAVPNVSAHQQILIPSSSTFVFLFDGYAPVRYSEDAGASWKKGNPARRVR